MSQPTEAQNYMAALSQLMDKAKPLAIDLSTQLAQNPDTVTSSVTGHLLTTVAELKAVTTAIYKLEMRYRSSREILGQINT